jgi:hypothetical protein
VAQNNSKAASKKFPKTSNPSFVYEVKDTATDMRSGGRCTNSDFPVPLYNFRHLLLGKEKKKWSGAGEEKGKKEIHHHLTNWVRSLR